MDEKTKKEKIAEINKTCLYFDYEDTWCWNMKCDWCGKRVTESICNECALFDNGP